MNCSKCINKCKAACCGIVPIPVSIYEKHKHKANREVLKENVFDDIIIPKTKDCVCPFLSDDFSCLIYEERPDICKKFGDESHLLMTCSFQSNDGQIRSRPEKREIQRKVKKYFKQHQKKWTTKAG